MNKLYFILIAFLILTNCSSFKKAVGLEKDVPDEFLIKRNNSLQKPPNYNLLPPGTKDKDTESQAINNSNNNDLKTIIDSNLKSTKSSDMNKSIKKESELEKSILKKLDN